jgi:hypothetical protein
MMIRRLMLLLFLLAPVLRAQIQVNINDSESVGDDFAKNVVSAVKARLNSGSRYQVAEKRAQGELFLAILCFGHEHTSGGTCAVGAEYLPADMSGLVESAMPVTLLNQKDFTVMAETIFDAFVEATTRNNLEAIKNKMKIGVYLAYQLGQFKKPDGLK